MYLVGYLTSLVDPNHRRVAEGTFESALKSQTVIRISFATSLYWLYEFS